MGARRSVVLAVGTVEIAGLVDDREGHAAAGGVGPQEEPVAGEGVEEKESHDAYRYAVGGVCRKHHRSDVDDAVDVGQRDHHYSEPHGHGICRSARKILLQPQQHRPFSLHFTPAHAQHKFVRDN